MTNESRVDLMLRMLGGQPPGILADESGMSEIELNELRSRFVRWGSFGVSSPMTRLLACTAVVRAGLKKVQWAATIQSVALVVSVILTYLLVDVTSRYTTFTQQMFNAQYEKYAFDALGDARFDVEVLPSTPPRHFGSPQLQVRITNLAPFPFKEPSVQLFAAIADHTTQERQLIMVFDASAVTSTQRFDVRAPVTIRDDRNDLLRNLRAGNFLMEGKNELAPQFEIERFVAHIEALTPGRVLWRFTNADERAGDRRSR